MPDDKQEKIEKEKEDKQNPEKIDNEVKQVSEFEKDELFDPNNIAALIDKSKKRVLKLLIKLTKLLKINKKMLKVHRFVIK